MNQFSFSPLPALPFSVTEVAGWMCYGLLVGGVVTLAALAAHDVQRTAQRAVRWVWFSAVIAIVGLSALAPLRRSTVMTLDLVPAVDSFAAAYSPAADAWTAKMVITRAVLEARRVLVTPFATAMHATQEVLTRLPFDAHATIGLLWLLASLGTAGAFVWSYRRSRQRMRHWPLQRFDDVDARISPAVGPAVMGLAPSEIVLPSWLLSRSREEQRLVIAHEAEHVRARDPWLLVVACGAVALMPWNPALWYALGRLRLAIELDCDRRVLRKGIPTASYGALLIDLSALRPALPSAMPAFSCSGSYLERRLVAMTARRSRFSASRRTVGALVAAAAMATACESKLPTSAEIEAMDATSATTQAGYVELVDTARAVYIVDGKRVSSNAAKAIGAADIAEVRIVGKDKSSSAGEVHLITKDGQYRMVEDSSLLLAARTVEGKPIMKSDQDATLELRSVAKDTSVLGTRIRVRGTSTLNAKTEFDGLLVVDGEIAASNSLKNIAPESIATIEVVKGSAAAARYGDPRAANGVIVVTTKAKR